MMKHIKPIFHALAEQTFKPFVIVTSCGVWESISFGPWYATS